MAVVYTLAPNPKWYFLDATGKPAAGGTIQTFRNTDHSTPKFVYADPSGLFPYTDPIPLDGTGGSPVPMYWQYDTAANDLYYVVVKDAAGNIICTIDNFPIVGGGGVTPINSYIDIENHIVNGAFKFIDAATAADSVINPIPTDDDYRVAPACGFFKDSTGDYVDFLGTSHSGWVFSKRGGAGETSSYRFMDVTNIGEGFPNAPSANATRYFRYILSSSGAPQTLNNIYQAIPNVETFSGQTLTVSFDIRSTAAGTGFYDIYQFFGSSGGSAPISTAVTFAFDGANTWRRVSFQLVVPSVVGKTKGPVGDDMVQARFNFPLNAPGTFDVTNIQLQIGTFPTPNYIYQTYNQDQYKVLIDLLVLGNVIFQTGELKFVSGQDSGPIDIPGWIPLVDTTQEYIGSPASGARFADNNTRNLYVLWWNSFDNTMCPVSGGRGANALADFNANKTMKIPNAIIGTAIVATGLGPHGNFPFGTAAGELRVALSVSELPSHHHTVLSAGGSFGVQAGSNANASLAGTSNTGNTGSGDEHNNQQPTFYLYLYVKL